ncbi:MAG TPA: hypothetical protein VJ779_05250 [Acetobacteraceae bacterium]|nr:hypothetical protein [Acetobacteraceae bacterium]
MSANAPNHLHRLTARLPGPVRSALAWVLRPEAKWLRIPLGIVLILGGFLGFLPILGFWMIPLGALLLAEDFPLVRKPTIRAIDAIESWWARRGAPPEGKRERHGNL